MILEKSAVIKKQRKTIERTNKSLKTNK